MVIGSSNYLNLSPYRISAPVRKISVPFTSHWFLIQVISTLVDLSTFGHTKNIYFSSENMVSNGWFRMYLDQEQLQFLKDSTYFKVYPIEKKYKLSTRKMPESGNFYVHASSDWEPPEGSRIVFRVSESIYYVENLMIEKVKNDPRVIEINPSGTIEMLNRYNSGFLQNGHQQSYYHNKIFAPLRPLHDIGLDGTGQVVNVVDSGVDVFNAFFYDSENSLESITNQTNMNHRKVVRIEAYADNTDLKNGHGTHVAGTACGKAYCDDCGISQYNGIASGAKLYFGDIGNSTSGENSGRVDLKQQAQIFDQLDVHVSSNSWGYSQNLKDVEFSYNKAAFDNPNVLYVFAAGNSKQYNTIYCPANAKNIATIGSIEATSAALLEFSNVEVFIQNETQIVEGTEFMTKIISASSKAEKMKYFVNLSAVTYRNPYLPQNCTDPEKECGDPVPDPDFDAKSYYNNTVVVLNTELHAVSDEDFCTMANNIAAFGAEAALYTPNYTYYKCSTVPTIPMIRVNNVSYMQDILTMNDVSLLQVSGSDNSPFPKASYQASKGPADSGLSKPDFCTPGGNVYSAKSHGSDTEGVEVNALFDNNVIRKSGTSMSTPAASALAVLVFQYFREGYYPGIKKNSGKSITPTSCLLRAVLVNTAIKPSTTKPESKSSPNNDVGFGVPILDNALGFTGKGFRIVDNETIPSDSHRVYTINTNSNSVDLNVTLVYLDPPLDTDNEAIFFADLDLYIKSPNGKIYMGNNVSYGESLALIERVIIDKEEIPSNGGAFEIHVISSKYPIESTKISYAIAVNGPFEQSDLEKNHLYLESKEAADDECPENCNGNGNCKKGMCVCNDDFVGPYCSIPVSRIENGNSYNQPYEYKQIKYFKLPLSQNALNVKFDIVKSFDQGPVYLCTSFNENPGKIWNAGWECHLTCPQEDPDSDVFPTYQNYSLDIPKNQNPSSLYFALYSSYYKSVDIGLNNVFVVKDGVDPTGQTSKPTSKPTSVPTSEPTSVPTSEDTHEPVHTTQSSSSGSSDSSKTKEKTPVWAIALSVLIVLCVVAAVVIVVLIVINNKRKQEAQTNSLGMSLISNAALNPSF